MQSKKMKKEKMFISAYACEPYKGSEIGVGWNWVLQLSKKFEVWVLTRESNKENIEEWLSKQTDAVDIKFVYYDLPKALTVWKKGLRGVRLYYNLWQIFSNKIVKRIMSENDIDIYHLLTYGNLLWRVSRFGMKKFFVWGPAGGVDYIPRKFSSYYGFKFQVREIVRRFVINTLPINFYYRKKCKNANLIFCKTKETVEAIPEQYKSKALLFTDCAVNEDIIKQPSCPEKEMVRYVAAGRLDAWRNFDILIEAFTNAYKENQNIELIIVGDGKDADRMNSLINIREMTDNIILTGHLSMDDYYKEMEKADVVINPSYKESGVTMSFDSLAMAKPLICIETGGYTNNFKKGSAEIIDKSDRESLIEEMTNRILKLTNKSTRYEMSKKAYETAVENTWDKKGEEICDIISNAYSNQ